MTADIVIENHGSIILFRPLCRQAKQWLQDSTQAEDWQWFGGALAVEPRYAADLAEGAMDAGLEVSKP